MSLANDLATNVSNIISTPWNKRTGQVVPTTEGVALNGGAVELDATYLYADLANSSKIAKNLDRRIAAKILKSFLMTATTCIKKRGGTPISFDGDRVLGVFVGDSKNTSAARCALNISYGVKEIIRPKFEANYDSVKDADFAIEHACGVDTGTVLIVRAGARGSNDLISIGRGPNLAAKMSDIRENKYCSYITSSVYNSMADSSKISKTGLNMWESRTYKYIDSNVSIYRSNWTWGA
jgi:class 3 adenylate cyclase